MDNEWKNLIAIAVYQKKNSNKRRCDTLNRKNVYDTIQIKRREQDV